MTKDEKKEIFTYAEKLGITTSEFVYSAIKEKLNINKLSDSQSQFFELFENAFKKSFDIYFKQLMVALNRSDFNTRWLLKQQDIFMQHLKVPQTIEDLNFSSIEHPILTKAKEIVLKDIRKMSANKSEVDDE